MTVVPVCCVLGLPLPQEDTMDALQVLQGHITTVLGAEPLERWTAEVAFKLKQKKNKAIGGEMKFGVNVAAPFVGMKRDDGSSYPFARQYCVRRSDMAGRLLVVQEMAEGGSRGQDDLACEGRLKDIIYGDRELETSLALRAPLVTRLKAIVDGQAYRLGDLLIRTGTFRKGATYRGLVLEIEYQPCCRIDDGLAFIEAFCPSVAMGKKFRPASNLRDGTMFGNSNTFSVKHIAAQMADLFSIVFA